MFTSDKARTDPPRHMSRIEHLTWQLCLTISYVLLGIISNYYTACASSVSIFWPGSGLILGALLIGGQRFIWGALLGMLILNSLLHHSLSVALGIALGSGIEAWFGYYLLIQHHSKKTLLLSLSGYLRLFMLGGAIASIFAAIIGTLTLLFAGIVPTTEYWHSVSHWWMGDLLGVVLITPLMLVWFKPLEKNSCGSRKVICLGILILTTLIGQTVFVGWLDSYVSEITKSYWMFLLISWIAIELGRRATTLSLLIISIQAMLGTSLNKGYFAHDIALSHLHNFWAYMLILSLVGMAMTIYVFSPVIKWCIIYRT